MLVNMLDGPSLECTLLIDFLQPDSGIDLQFMLRNGWFQVSLRSAGEARFQASRPSEC